MNNVEFAKAADDRMDAGSAKYEFYEYCTDRPGVHPAKILAEMGEVKDSKAFWDAATYHAMTAFDNFIKA